MGLRQKESFSFLSHSFFLLLSLLILFFFVSFAKGVSSHHRTFLDDENLEREEKEEREKEEREKEEKKKNPFWGDLKEEWRKVRIEEKKKREEARKQREERKEKREKKYYQENSKGILELEKKKERVRMREREKREREFEFERRERREREDPFPLRLLEEEREMEEREERYQELHHGKDMNNERERERKERDSQERERALLDFKRERDLSREEKIEKERERERERMRNAGFRFLASTSQYKREGEDRAGVWEDFVKENDWWEREEEEDEREEEREEREEREKEERVGEKRKKGFQNIHSLKNLWPFVIFRSNVLNVFDSNSISYPTSNKEWVKGDSFQNAKENMVQEILQLHKENKTIREAKGVPEIFNPLADQSRIFLHKGNQMTSVMKEHHNWITVGEYLREHIKRTLSLSIPSSLEVTWRDISIVFSHSFFLLRKGGGRHRYHTHGRKWALVWYSKIPEENKDENILFVSDLRWAKKASTDLGLLIREGEVVLHPGWVYHGTVEVPWKDMRMLYALNFVASVKQDMPFSEVVLDPPSVWEQGTGLNTAEGTNILSLFGSSVYHRFAPDQERKYKKRDQFQHLDPIFNSYFESKILQNRKIQMDKRNLFVTDHDPTKLFIQFDAETEDLYQASKEILSNHYYEDLIFRQRIQIKKDSEYCQETPTREEVAKLVEPYGYRYFISAEKSRDWKNLLGRFATDVTDTVNQSLSEYKWFTLFVMGNDCGEKRWGTLTLFDPRELLVPEPIDTLIQEEDLSFKFTLRKNDFISFPSYCRKILMKATQTDCNWMAMIVRLTKFEKDFACKVL